MEYLMLAFAFLVTGFPVMLVSYFCGCINGAIVTSKLFYGDDVRSHGSGNAGLTNYYRTYGAKYALLVILCDMGKAAAAVGLSLLYFNLAGGAGSGFAPYIKYLAGLFCMIGHMFPVTAHFKGGKGILCSGMLLFLLDWRIALVGWGAFLVLAGLTRYISLGSVAAAVSFPFTTYFIYHDIYLSAMSILMAGMVLWAHRANIVRLCKGTESKFRFHVKAPKKDRE